MKKVLTWAGVALLVFFVVSNPTGAANAAKTMGSGLTAVGQGFSSFLAAIVG